MSTAAAFLIAATVLTGVAAMAFGGASLLVGRSYLDTVRLLTDPLTAPVWNATHRQLIASYAIVAETVQARKAWLRSFVRPAHMFTSGDVRILARRGWTPDRILRLLIPSGATYIQPAVIYAEIARHLRPERFEAWQPYLAVVFPDGSTDNGAVISLKQARVLARWDKAVGPLAPLAAAAGLSLEETTTQARRETMDEGALRMLVAMRSPLGV